MEELNSVSDDAIFYDAICKDADLEQPITETDESLKNPNLEIAQLKFILQLPECSDDKSKSDILLEYIKRYNMAPYYEIVCRDLNWTANKSILMEMEKVNAETLEALDQEIKYAQDNLGVADLKEAYLNKANYLTRIGSKEEAIKTFDMAYDNTVALGCKLENIFRCITLGLFFNDLDLIKCHLGRCEGLLEQNADWHYSNCFNIYKGLYCVSVRDFSTACELFNNAISTFECTELISYEWFMKYTVLAAMIDLNRRELKKKIINNPDVFQVLHFNTVLKKFITSFYDSEYKEFFSSLAQLETVIKQDMFMHPHYQFYVREMKIKAYDQLLSTYISLNISYMAEQFGVTEEYIENDISKFISAQRLNYKIDKVSRKIINVLTDRRSEMFEKVVKHGDVLLNRVQKLYRVLNV